MQSLDRFIQLPQLRLSLGKLLLGEQPDRLHLMPFQLIVRLLLTGNLIDLLADACVGLHAGDLLQDDRLLIVVAIEESGEFPLCQQGGAAELPEIQTDRRLNSGPHLLHPGQ